MRSRSAIFERGLQASLVPLLLFLPIVIAHADSTAPASGPAAGMPASAYVPQLAEDSQESAPTPSASAPTVPSPSATAPVASTATAAEDGPLLAVGLSRSVGSAASIAVAATAGIVVTSGDGDKIVEQAPAGSTYTITAESSGQQIDRTTGTDQRTIGVLPYALTFQCADDTGLRVAAIGAGGLANVVWHRYRGTITVRRGADGLLTGVDNVPLEEYLYGVLAPEMGANAPPEALKAQAVASRTFAVKNRGRFASDGFDIDDSTRSQQYDGMDAESPATIAAVNATRGQVLAYQGSLIDAYYCTDSGGTTAPDTTGTHPYLQAVSDSPGDGLPDYGAASAYRTWDCHFTLAQLTALLNKDPRTRMDNFVSLSIDSVDESGRIVTATVADANGALKTVTGPELREILGYDTLKSTKVTLTVKSNGDYVFHGMGWGHGLGMSQVSAAAMAGPPYNKTYIDILAHYYVGAKIVDMSTLTLSPRAP